MPLTPLPGFVTINTNFLVGEEVFIIDKAAKAVRMGFNPSASKRVDRIKALAAALISELESVAGENPEAVAETVLATRSSQIASMWGVFAATSKM